ncbi:hypothetical protein HDF25_004790 [Pedobacter cryoconitis]|uniref:Uncharacterized protein n=1 Tax=Pedobacter cryoconitis TaxID=188932 RepID=A0A7X0MKJ0_9SPHI|nr:hypothetical protein [Pedobacter cryoconitis]
MLKKNVAYGLNIKIMTHINNECRSNCRQAAKFADIVFYFVTDGLFIPSYL